MSVNTIVGYALFSWIPTSFARVHGWTMGDIGLGYGLIILATGPAGRVPRREPDRQATPVPGSRTRN
jgi:hypothetical protein